MSHKIPWQQMCWSAVARNSGFWISTLKDRTYLGIVYWEPVGVDAALFLELALKRIGYVL